MNLRAFFGVTCGVLLLIVVVVYIDGAQYSAVDVTTLMQLMNSTGLLSPNPKSAAKNKLSALDLKRINVNGPAMRIIKATPLNHHFVSMTMLQRELERLHVRRKVIREAMSAVRLGIIDPESVLQTAKEAYDRADVDGADTTPIQININVNPNDEKHGAKAEYGANRGSEADSVEVWQPFPGKDPSKHAIVWRKVLRKKLPVLRPLAEAMENVTSSKTAYNASTGNYSFPVPEGAIVLPTAGHAPNKNESSVIESAEDKELPESDSSYVDIEIRH
ncbi:hypothetical protein GUITHDRAFT_143221 [Guillardia theta CCMP2712]|uniref:Uncharacterized protein n=1 Tax=Guillardia theta (strain CCMP2712) TaxID=905079 RepID=L1IUB6_GUITC|nr:hypothetical protein GUITHDRAFT_143221 [Guillardia theta CCMP2712]EKX39836.1 hypothetical protein GUITHDRAFT_143221 [Guillardia theta CCMP2712]|eukprot:XP_005826816.1 hypothetical protein GUITHDRAFT_143221 [Guillardia theta CCMP2712]